ncbi:MAG: hypothetical protein JNK78_15165 [Planctomycetes bacterium]|nr:hypothetical protein [Planctomycetota bacterium]
MRNLVFAIGLSIGVSAIGQSQIARFDFQNQLSSVQPAFAYVGDVVLSKSHQFSGPASDRALSLPLQWNSGGSLSFTVWPGYGQTVDFAHLRWFVLPNSPGVQDCVQAVSVFANGLQVAFVNPIPQNSVIDVDLTSFALLQNTVFPVTFDFVFVGSPTGTSTHEISYFEVTGSACDFSIQSVTPTSLATATTDFFQILGDGFRTPQGASRVVQVKFGSTVLVPYSPNSFVVGSYEVFSQWKVRVRPPQCIPPGQYTIEIQTDCDVKSVQVTLVDPTAPVIATASTYPAGTTQCFSVHAGGAGPQIIVLFASPLDQPSVVPGLLALDLADNFSLYGTVFAIGDCVNFCLNVPLVKIDTCHFFQAAIWHSTNLSLTSPLPTTRRVTTCWY